MDNTILKCSFTHRPDIVIQLRLRCTFLILYIFMGDIHMNDTELNSEFRQFVTSSKFYLRFFFAFFARHVLAGFLTKQRTTMSRFPGII